MTCISVENIWDLSLLRLINKWINKKVQVKMIFTFLKKKCYSQQNYELSTKISEWLHLDLKAKPARLVYIQDVLRLKKNKYWQKSNRQLNFEIVSKNMKP